MLQELMAHQESLKGPMRIILSEIKQSHDFLWCAQREPAYSSYELTYVMIKLCMKSQVKAVCAAYRYTLCWSTFDFFFTCSNSRFSPPNSQAKQAGLKVPELIQAFDKQLLSAKKKLIIISSLHMDQSQAAYHVGVDERHHQMSSWSDERRRNDSNVHTGLETG